VPVVEGRDCSVEYRRHCDTKEKAGRGRPRLSVTSADVPALEMCVDVATADVPMQEVDCKGGGGAVEAASSHCRAISGNYNYKLILDNVII